MCNTCVIKVLPSLNIVVPQYPRVWELVAGFLWIPKPKVAFGFSQYTIRLLPPWHCNIDYYISITCASIRCQFALYPPPTPFINVGVYDFYIVM